MVKGLIWLQILFRPGKDSGDSAKEWHDWSEDWCKKDNLECECVRIGTGDDRSQSENFKRLTLALELEWVDQQSHVKLMSPNISMDINYSAAVIKLESANEKHW